ncbi:MAG TPA: carboxypeptidase regulatory-like domain-containing protein [Bryobacteraceae bacterium]|nr:carboxypeptidase regulatory-like domain-containing protein [Bryobacteraceae bacterium]
MRFKTILWVLQALGILSIAWGQTATGVITGVVTDAAGASVAGAIVTLLDQQTNQTREQTTTTSGLYEFRALPRGLYTLHVEMAGFKKSETKNLQLTVAQTMQIDIKLELGQVSESVTVEATAAQVQASEASLAQVIDEKRVRELPLNGRNFMQLAFLSSGIITAGRASATQRQANYGPAFSAGGQRDNTSTVLVDGIEISGMELNNYPYAIPSLESVGEFRVLTSGASAEFGGNSGAFVNVVTRRGSNEVHGSLFEFLRNNKMDSRNFFDVTGRSAPNKRNQFGFLISGPVYLPKLYNGKDRTFFTFSWEWQRQRNGTTSTALVPTAQERTGDFSATSGTIVDPLTKTPFSNNQIPVSRINPVGRGLLALYPVSNNSDPARNFVNAPLRKFDFSLPSFRVDHKLTSRDNLFWRTTINEPDDVGPGQALTQAFKYDAVQSERHVQYVLGDTHVFSPAIVNEVNLGFVRMNRIRNSADSFVRNWVDELGIKGVPTQPLTYGAPAITISGHPQAGFSTNNAFFQWITQSVQVVDNLSIVRGHHTFKTGLTYQKKQLNSTQWGAPNGNYAFTGVYSSLPPVGTPTRQAAIADTLLGFPATYSVQTTPYEQRLRYSNFATYLQDDWRATSNLTVNIGLRWEYFGKPHDLFNRIASFDLSTGQQLLAGQNGTPRSLINPDRNNFGPRIGFAWRALGTESLVVRGAYGVFFSPPIGNDFRSRGFQDPFAFLVTRTYRPASPTSPLPEFTADDPLAGANRQTNLTRSGVDRNLRDAYVQQWNLSIQKLVTANTLWEVAYRGSKSTRLQTNLDYNEITPNPPQPPDFRLIFPYPTLAAVGILESRAAANYHALTTRLERRYSKGMTFLVNYTFSKTLTDVDSSTVGVANGAGAFGTNTIRNLKDNKGPAVFDRPHQLNLSAVYETPLLKTIPTAARFLLGGWQVAPIWTAYVGAYLTPGNFNVLYTGARPDVLRNPNLSRSDRSIDRWFDTEAIQNATPGRFGNAGKGIIQGSGVNNWDVNFSKNFMFRERHRVQFRAEFFNLFNHAQFDDPVLQPAVRNAAGQLLNPNAGRITSASDFGFRQTERVVQLGLKYTF